MITEYCFIVILSSIVFSQPLKSQWCFIYLRFIFLLTSPFLYIYDVPSHVHFFVGGSIKSILWGHWFSIWLKVNVGINCYYPFLNIFSNLVATTSGTTTTTYKPESTRMNTTIQSQTPGSTHTDTTIQSQTPGSSKEEDHVLSKDSLETNAVATSKSNFIIALSCFLCLCIT